MKTTPTLNGQTILVIGGTSGIGFGVALAALNNGAAKLIIGSSSPEKVKNAIERLKSTQKDAEVKGIVIDVTDLAGVEKGVKDVGVINHLVFTSGDPIGGPMGKNITEIDITNVKDKLFDIRFWGAVQAAKSARFAPEGGSVTFTSGLNSFKPAPGWSLSAAINNAIIAITKGLAVDFAPLGVRANCVSPGLINTEIFDAMAEDAKKARFEKASRANLAKRVGTPEDTAEAYLFLMKCGFITGETIKVDGGQLLAPTLD